MKNHLDEMTREKHGSKAGQRSSSRVSLAFGVGVLALLFVEAQAVLAAMAFGSAEWNTFAGAFKWQGAFAGSTLVPYVVKHWRAVAKEVG